ncbi:hypothetical protein KP509_16G069700 [Ceratopteris richardii]|nr:hypothetical protein KP509_16G069700 [Ceratopteris richardii]
MAARAKELKEEGNLMFQKKEYSAAMDHYELALKLTPPDHQERAILHSNRAACLMQMKPVQYDAAISECDLALRVRPAFPRALLRRARAFEATGKYELALQDIELLLEADSTHPDAVAMATRIRESMAINQKEERKSGPNQGTTPAVELPVEVETASEASVNAKQETLSLAISDSNCGTETNACNEDDHDAVSTPIPLARDKELLPQACSQKTRVHTVSRAPFCEPPLDIPQSEPLSDAFFETIESSKLPPFDPCKSESLKKVIHQDDIQILHMDDESGPRMRPVKLIYGHDIRLGEVPVDCKFSDLRKLVKERFPSSKSILIKYKDAEGDLVTITSTRDLRFAEAAAAIDAVSRGFPITNMDAFSQEQHIKGSAIGLPVVPSKLDQLRLHVMEVPHDQEPYDKEEISELADEKSSDSRENPGEVDSQDNKLSSQEQSKTKTKDEYDRWLLDFAQLFRSHLGIDPNGHIDLLEKGMDLCAEALEEIVSTEEGHKLFALAALKFQEMTALGFLNWGNLFMCAARKQLPHDEAQDSQLEFCEKLQAAFDWAQAQYALAEEKFQQSIQVKPDFCDAMLSLGQKDFESAKLHWSLAIAKQIDLTSWDSTEMLKLFEQAEQTMQRASEFLSKQGHHCKDVEYSANGKITTDDATCLKDSREANQRQSTFEQDIALKSQVYLFWGNILYEHSQVVFRLGLPEWKELLNASVEKFQAAGASPFDISTALEKHLSNSSIFYEASEKPVKEDNLSNGMEKSEDETGNMRYATTTDLIEHGDSDEEIDANDKNAADPEVPGF